ncbi:MAG: NADH/ubiquinone/plastoquinone [Gammaproteobacteria bacterium RIFCSPHIGHO2_12_FULL_41_15]|nr:MAG: NADH/ubiquinone/plastoquinone [Gammaproteobacteria bacterium RIFCSPHIGHO2_12_FULL_41_15]
MDWLPLSPLLVCLAMVILCCFFWSHVAIQKIIHVIGASILFIVVVLVYYQVMERGILVVQVGHYMAPFGISIVIDMFSAMMLFITAIIALCVSIYALIDISVHLQNLGFYPAYWVLLLGICGAFSTGDLFNLYVWFEVMLIASFVLMVLGYHKIQLDGAVKYVGMNLVATIFMLTGIALLYGMTGTLNMADLSWRLSQQTALSVSIVALLLTMAFAIKAALFPLFFWLPASYHTTTVSTSALFAGLLTKVGIYALIRLTTLIVPHDRWIMSGLLVSAGFTMLTGVLGAMSQYHLRRILSFHIISQIGYMVMGLAIGTPLALAGAIFYIAHHIIVKTNLFLISGIVHRLGKSFDIHRLSGFYKHHPLLTALFFISALSLAGFPPLSGFWAKFSLLKAAFIHGNSIIAFIALLVSFLTLYSMIKIWNSVFWKGREEAREVQNADALSWGEKMGLFTPVVVLVGITLIMSFMPQMFFYVAMQISAQLLDPTEYIHVVLGATAP